LIGAFKDDRETITLCTRMEQAGLSQRSQQEERQRLGGNTRNRKDRIRTVQSKILADASGRKTYAIIMETGDEAMSCLQRFVEAEGIVSAQFTAIGAFSDAVLKYFDWEAKAYREIPVSEQVEVASLIGDVAIDPAGRSALHIHLVIGRRDGSAMAGHLGEGRVRPTLEVILSESPVHLRKKHDPESGLALIRTEG
jgi:predicted DNA-binding protein with PD1-like motif